MDETRMVTGSWIANAIRGGVWVVIMIRDAQGVERQMSLNDHHSIAWFSQQGEREFNTVIRQPKNDLGYILVK